MNDDYGMKCGCERTPIRDNKFPIPYTHTLLQVIVLLLSSIIFRRIVNKACVYIFCYNHGKQNDREKTKRTVQ